jgi:hypothetical protein
MGKQQAEISLIKDEIITMKLSKNKLNIIIDADTLIRTHWPKLLVAFILLINIYIAVYYANQPLLESYGFRQTQTALSSYLQWTRKKGQ